MYLQVQYEGLQTAYMEDAATNTLIKKFLALPMLPAEHIPPVFESLSDEAVTEPMEKLAAYIKKQWIDTRHFPPQQLECILLCYQDQQRRRGVALPAQP